MGTRAAKPPPAVPVGEHELAAVSPTLFSRPLLWPGLALPPQARERAGEAPWSAYWAVRLGPLDDPSDDRQQLEQVHAAFLARGDALGALLACAAAIETFYYDETVLDPLDAWIARLEALVRSVTPWPNAEVAAEVMACGTGVLLRQPGHPLLAHWAAEAPRALARTAIGPSRIKYAAFVVQHHLWRGEFGACGAVIDALPGLDLSLLRPPEAVLWLLGVLAHCRYTAQYARGRAAVRDALALCERHGLRGHVYHVHSHGASLALAMGDDDATARHLEALRQMLGTRSQTDQTIYWHLSTGQALLAGRTQDAVALARSTIEHSRALGGALHGVAHRLSLAHALLAAGDPHAAAEARGAVDAAQAVHASLSAFSAGLVLSSALAREGRPSESDDALRAALQIAAAHDFHTPSGWWQPAMVADRLARALEVGIEPDYTRRLVRRNRLACPQPTLQAWPWPLELRAFGGLAVRVDGQALPERTPQRPLDLLRALLAHGAQGLPVSTALDWLWPDADFDQQRKSFDAALLRLRRVLGDESLLRLDGSRLVLDRTRCWTDVHALAETDWSPDAAGGPDALRTLAERLLHLVRGPLLDGLDTPWALGARERARRRFVLSLAPIAQRMEATSPPEACALYERALDADPLAESLTRRLIALRLDAGERAEALRAWHHCKAMLSLHGTSPAAETVALVRRAGLAT